MTTEKRKRNPSTGSNQHISAATAIEIGRVEIRRRMLVVLPLVRRVGRGGRGGGIETEKSEQTNEIKALRYRETRTMLQTTKTNKKWNIIAGCNDGICLGF